MRYYANNRGRAVSTSNAGAASQDEADYHCVARRAIWGALERRYGASYLERFPKFSLTNRQVARLAARLLLLEKFDVFKGTVAVNDCAVAFMEAYGPTGCGKLPEWARDMLPKLSRRSLERWLADRNACRFEALAGRYR